MLRTLPGRSGGRAGSAGGSAGNLSELRVDVGEPSLPRAWRLRATAAVALFLFLLALVSLTGAARSLPSLPLVQASSADSAVAAAAAALIDVAARAEAMLHKAEGGSSGGGVEWTWDTDEAASWQALKAAIPADSVESESPAIAFLFLTRGLLPHAHLWQRFLDAAPEPHAWRVHVHAPPGVLINESNAVGAPAFHGRELRNGTASVAVQWGELSVVDAERRLLAAALADPAVQRLVLLSESCVPLRSFAFVQRYLLSSEGSYVDSFEDSVNSRYHPAFEQEGVPPAAWRKGSQWAALTRADALFLVSDERVFSAFQRVPIFAPDEHYKPTALALADGGGVVPIQPRPVTHANWWPDTRAHPKLYVVQETTSELVQDLQRRREFFRPAEGEHVRCAGPRDAPWLGPQDAHEADAGAPCWLFARKFTEKAGHRLAELVDWHAV
jgi:Core-2/I-Branching enzyme